MTVIRFEVPGKPVSTNQGYQPARWGKRHGLVLTTEGEMYKARLEMAAARAWMQAGRPAPLERAVVAVRFGFKTRGSDLDGPLKFALDCLAPRLIVNDNRVERIGLVKLPPGNPTTEVVVAAPGCACPLCGHAEQAGDILEDLAGIREG